MRDEGRTILLRHARHGRGRALLPPRDAARARRDGGDRASPATSADRYLELNFGRDAGRAASEGDGSAARRRRPGARISRPGSRTSTASARRRSPQGEPRARFTRPGALQRARSRTRPSRVPASTSTARPLFVASHRRWSTSATGRFAAGRARSSSRSRFDNVLAPGRYYVDVAARAPGRRRRRDRPPAERHVSCVVTGTRRTGGLVDLPHDDGRARDGRRRAAAAGAPRVSARAPAAALGRARSAARRPSRSATTARASCT